MYQLQGDLRSPRARQRVRLPAPPKPQSPWMEKGPLRADEGPLVGLFHRAVQLMICRSGAIYNEKAGLILQCWEERGG